MNTPPQRARHLLVIGGQRCGTTTLHGLLDAHPEITMARPARPEPKVFCSDQDSARGREWYLRTWFGHAREERLLGDKSTSYLEDPRAARRAADVLRHVAVVVQLRDPVERAVSNWRFSTDHGMEERPLDVALIENLDGGRRWDRASTSVSPYAYLERGRYADHLRPWLDAFPDSTHVVFLAELIADPQTTMAGLFTALGVDGTALPETLPALNESSSPADELPEELEARLRDYFADSDDRLRRLVGRDLPWPSRAPSHPDPRSHR